MTKPKLKSAFFEPSGGRPGAGFPRMWAVVGCSFSWDVNPAQPQLRVTVPLERDPDKTYGELQRQAQDHAIALLREALAELEAHQLDELAGHEQGDLQ